MFACAVLRCVAVQAPLLSGSCNLILRRAFIVKSDFWLLVVPCFGPLEALHVEIKIWGAVEEMWIEAYLSLDFGP